MLIAMTNRRTHTLRVKDSIRAIKRRNHAPTQRSRRTRFIVNDVTLLVRKNLIPTFTHRTNRKLIRHRPARDKQRRILPQQHRDFRLKRLHRGLIPKHIIPKRRTAHSFPHRKSRPRDSIATKINHRPKGSGRSIEDSGCVHLGYDLLDLNHA